MTLKNLAIATAAALTLAAVPMASADNTQPPLVDLTPLGCTVLGDAQLAAWAWEEGGAQTQFGGGAVYNVAFKINGNGAYDSLEVEVELVRYEPDLVAKMVYACPSMGSQAKERAEAGSCMAEIADVDAAVEEATNAKLLETDQLGDDDDLEITASTLVGVYVKAMNPGVVRGPGGRQNYQKIDVCEIEENGAEGNDE